MPKPKKVSLLKGVQEKGPSLKPVMVHGAPTTVPKMFVVHICFARCIEHDDIWVC